MINIVVVSHSARLAQGVEELARQMMSSNGCRLALAAGVDDEQNPIGTDAIKVMEAIESVADASGIVVLMDLGSALLSAETALELLDPEIAERVTLCSAPLVEGTLAAVVTANAGGTLEQVLAEARGALQAKQAQLGDNSASDAPETPSVPLDDANSVSWQVLNPHGLHARPAARLAEVLAPFDAELVLEKAGRGVNPRSVSQLALLQVGYGDTVRLFARGPQAAEALAAFAALSAQHFGETISEPQTSLAGVAVKESAVSGPLCRVEKVWPAVIARQITPDDVAAEQQRLQQAIRRTLTDLEQLAERTEQLIGQSQAGIFQAHAMLLDDEDLQQAATAKIAQHLCSAEQALAQELEQIAADYRALDDAYLQARELDVRDILRRALSHLQQQSLPQLTLNQPAILVMDEILPSEVVLLERQHILGICLSSGNALSHAAILAKAMGIPMLVGLGTPLNSISDGQKATLDSAQGVLQLAS
ncbi:dihydroxyacetone kinase phosphoryl donor subunit DhaM [Serratia microhaemolytica]|uniref:dihydroxyacetone kinase phosphoryl donor subunit DhaM n=1 Tax=Serratia microhaemolytica TaxID=2675110 RepID=UPI000FDDED95|nr:dihydroxyacetone kinase phosphoryl donor subunit DhaM [Serratia microhaemolytica]